MKNMSKKQKRHLRPSIKFAIEMVIGIAIVFSFITMMFWNHGTQVERYNDLDYVQIKGN